jgi:hypothetical protein
MGRIDTHYSSNIHTTAETYDMGSDLCDGDSISMLTRSIQATSIRKLDLTSELYLHTGHARTNYVI